MRYFKSLVAFVALLFATSCAVDNIDGPSVMPNDSDVVTVMGRVTRFTDCDVDTRGVKNGDEGKITSMAMALFQLNDDGTAISGDCEYFEYKPNQNELLFTIERGTNYETNTPYAMYIFCNVDMSSFNGKKPSLDALLAETYNLENLNIPENGFPMMGSLGDTFSTKFDKDNQVFILSPTENGKLTAPKVDNKTQTLLTIPMKAMYAKVNFTIEVRPDQTIEGNYSPQFTLEGCTINNAAGSVDFDNTTNSDTNVFAAQSCNITGNKIASGANKINFSFYLPERYLTPTINCEEFKYPFGGLNDKGEITTVTGYSNLRKEDQKYAQRFKSKLVEGKAATNVVISGQFRDHQNHYWDVDYTIYLGEDNYGNFDIRRNFEYNNYVTIRGIQSSDDMSDNQNGISIDHRVNVERTQPAIISLRREVLLDSHFEVRPLRIRANSAIDDDNITHVKVEVVNHKTTTWMRLERSFGEGGDGENHQDIYIKEGVSAGKRKYFTFDLITGSNDTTNGDLAPLNESTSVVVPLRTSDECVWIYVDECTEVGDAVRAGQIKVTYGNLEGGKFTATTNTTFPAVYYIINQRKLFEVEGTNKYHIEYEEEYLHNFDADDNYGETDYEGMQWGLNGVQLSYDNKALYFGNESQSWLTNLFNGIVNYVASTTGINPIYDFYVPKHDTGVSTLATKRDFRGYVFCNEIIQTINGQGNHDTDATNNIDVLQLDQKPESAVEYCYNKNKRTRNGQVATTANSDNVNWYLPAIDEIEDIVMSKYGNGLYTYARFLEFQSQYYWSSQPSYIKNFSRYEITGQNGEYYYDDTNYARATSVWYDSGNQKFDYSRSGTTSYFSALRIYATSIWNVLDPDYEILEEGTYQNHKLGTISREPGNQPRTEKNRIRCVRKSQYTNTSAN